MLRVTFADTASRDNFASRFKLDDVHKTGDVQLDIGWHLLQFAKLDDNAIDYDELAVLTASPSANAERHFIVKGDPAAFSPHVTSQQDLGNGFYLVTSTDGTTLGDYVDSIEDNATGMKLLGNVASLEDMSTTTESTLDPTSSDGQWARIRVASKYRPLLAAFSTHEMVYNSAPELILMDSGVNFDHPEFDYPGLAKENFYTLPAFNGDFTDKIGHGTSVASLACGKNLGIASNLKLVSVKIGEPGHNATLLEVGEAIDAILNRISSDPTKTRVINMSFGVARSSWLDAKVQSLLTAGALVVCAAGNNGIDVADISPAGMTDVITVGSIDKYDIPSGFNNISPSDAGVTTGHGLSLDLFAPGENVMVAYKDGVRYYEGSGTSFAAPLVAGVAVEIASLFSTIVPYSTLKDKVLSTATQNALLFEDDRFSENQNNLVHLITSDPNTNYKSSDMTSYLGTFFGTGDSIVFDLNSSLNVSDMSGFLNETFTYSIEFLDPAIEALYSKYFSVNATTGQVTIASPTESWQPEEKLRMVEFKGKASSSTTNMETNTLFFFDSNPTFHGTLDNDITLALTETNSISFYACWFGIK
jgi:hypothetical protein